VIEILKGDVPTKKTATPLPPPDAQGRIQHALALPLSSFEPGEYTLKVTVAAGTGTASQKIRFVVAE
jgi:hypothetical protein